MWRSLLVCWFDRWLRLEGPLVTPRFAERATKFFTVQRFFAYGSSEKNVYSICGHIASECLAVRNGRFTGLSGTISHRISRSRPERQSSRLGPDSWNSLPHANQGDKQRSVGFCHRNQPQHGQTRRISPIIRRTQDWSTFSCGLDRRDQADLGAWSSQHPGTGPSRRGRQKPVAPQPVAGDMAGASVFAPESGHAGGDWPSVGLGEVANVCRFAGRLEHPVRVVETEASCL